jgi:hypothetical protein
MLMLDEGPLGWLERPEAEEKVAPLRDDLRTLGLAGTVVLLAQPAAPDASVAREARDAVKKELGVGDGTISELVLRYAEKKGARGRELARKLVGRTILDVYGLQDHGLTSDDVVRALDLAARSRGEEDARDLARALARCGKNAARVVLGHLEEQINLVHRLQVEEVMFSEIDRALLEFAPRIYARRLPSMLKALLPLEARVRLVFVLWGRLRGFAVSKEPLVHALDAVSPEKPLELVSALASKDRAALLAHARDAEAMALEDAARTPLP